MAVRIETEGDMPSEIHATAVHTEDEAERYRKYGLNRDNLRASEIQAIVPTRGKPIPEHVRTSGKATVLFNVDIESTQDWFAVVQADWPDGRRACKVVPIPDGRKSREVTVVLP